MSIRMCLYKCIKQLPILNKYIHKIEELKERINVLEQECQDLAVENIDYRLKMKSIKNQKINIVFVCHRPAVWESLHTVYDALISDDNFDVKIVAIPNKKELKNLGLKHEYYESEGAEDFWKEYDCIEGFNYDTQEWIDLSELKPDYVFFQQPYNITRCDKYKSWNVSKYAKICYVAYAANFIGKGVFEETSPQDFMKNVYVYFTQNELDDILVKKVLNNYNNTFTKTFMSGFPRYDELKKYSGSQSSTWNFNSRENRFRVLWTPRWCTNEGNCSFFDYKEKIVEYFYENEKYDFVFRPHPQAFDNWNRTEELSEEEAKRYIEKYKKANNMCIDFSKEYFNTMYSSDCLISDVSSIMADYFTTGKPIIYCHKVNMFNDFSKKMSEGFYWVNNWNELIKVLNDLEKGIDPLKERRVELLYELAMNVGKENAGERVRKFILEDAKKYGIDLL